MQDQVRDGRQWSRTVRLSFTQPLGTGKILEVFGQRTGVDEDQDDAVFDIVDGESVYNTDLSNGFERTYNYLRGGFRLNRNSETTRFVLGLQLQSSDLEGVLLDRDETIATGYTHVLPNVDFRHQITPQQNLNIRYNTSTREPSLTQLQPFVDNSNPLDVYIGNPDLQPQYTHRVNSDYRFFDEFSFLNVFAYGAFTYTQDAISQSRVYDERGAQERMPVNAGGQWSTQAGIDFGTPVRRLGIEVGLNATTSYSRGQELINGDENESRIRQNGFTVRVENRIKEDFELRGSAGFTLNDVDYSLNDELDQDYVNSRYAAEGSWYPSDAWTVGSTFSYTVFGDRQVAAGDNVARWDAFISRYIAGNRGSIELRAYDLLNQSLGVNVSSSANSISETRTESLGQYVMLSLSYRLGRVGGDRGGFRGGPPRR